jgi:hypothetical protein
MMCTEHTSRRRRSKQLGGQEEREQSREDASQKPCSRSYGVGSHRRKVQDTCSLDHRRTSALEVKRTTMAATTGISFFAESLKHSAKPRNHSANKAWRTVHRQRLLCRVVFIGHSAKTFVECRKVLSQEKSSSWRLVTVMEPLPSVRQTSTRQRDRQRTPLFIPLPSALGGTRQRLLLCRVPRS